MERSLRKKPLKPIDLPPDNQCLIVFEWKDNIIDWIYATKYIDNGKYLIIITADGSQRRLVYYHLKQMEIIHGKDYQHVR